MLPEIEVTEIETQEITEVPAGWSEVEGWFHCAICGVADEFVEEGGICDDCFDEIEAEQEINDDMDGDHASALMSAGWGTDEDYGYFGDE